MRWLGRWACAALLIGGVAPVAGPAAPVCAADGARAALVVDTGEGVHSFCVALPDGEVSGLELIALAGEQHGLSYRFGHGGGAVCMLADVGATSDDCFERYPDFWGYWRGSSSGWSWSSTGAGSTSVRDGDIEGWSWGSGNDGNTHPRPPETSFSSVCPISPPSGTSAGPKERKKRQDSPPRPAAPAPAAHPIASSPEAAGPVPDSPDETGKRVRPKRKEPEGEREQHPRRQTWPGGPEPAPGRDGVLAAREVSAERRSPATGLAALGVAALLGGAGFVFSRRRRGAP